MKTMYFRTKAEMSAMATLQQGEAYRTRLTCGCKAGFNRRDGILVVLGDEVTFKLVRCKACRKEANHDEHK